MVEFFEAKEVFPAGGTARGFGGEEVRVGGGGGGGGGGGSGGGEGGGGRGFRGLRGGGFGEVEREEFAIGEELVGGEHGGGGGFVVEGKLEVEVGFGGRVPGAGR